MKIKLLLTTWSNNDISNVEDQILYKSFKKYNPDIDIVKIHYNRGKYHNIENSYGSLYGYQHEFLLYRVVLMYHRVKELDADFLILGDTNDVTCVAPVNNLPDLFDLENYVIIGAETNQWPMPMVKQNWENYTDYDQEHHDNKTYVNAGGILASKTKFLDLLDIARELLIENQQIYARSIDLDNRYGGAGSDQGIFTWIFNNTKDAPLKLDYESKFLLNTYGRSEEDYYIKNNKFYSKLTETSTFFIHDNGWDYGSPKFHDKLELSKLYQ
jgi:hypothetical protein